MKRNQMQNYIIQYSSFLETKNKRDILKVNYYKVLYYTILYYKSIN